MKVYLAGKITGDPNYREKFAAAAKKPLLCRLGLHSPCKTEYIEVTRRRSDRHGGKYHTNYIVCRRCGKLCYRMRRRRGKTI